MVRLYCYIDFLPNKVKFQLLPQRGVVQWRPANAPGRRGAARERADGVREHAELERAPEPHVPEERPRGRLGVAGEF